jgi:hypothetical protein
MFRKITLERVVLTSLSKHFFRDWARVVGDPGGSGSRDRGGGGSANLNTATGAWEICRDHAVIVIGLIVAGLDRIPARRKGPM